MESIKLNGIKEDLKFEIKNRKGFIKRQHDLIKDAEKQINEREVILKKLEEL